MRKNLINVAGFRQYYESPAYRTKEINEAISELILTVLDNQEIPSGEALEVIATRFKNIRNKQSDLISETTDKRYSEITKFVAKELGFTSKQGRRENHTPRQKIAIAREYHLMLNEPSQSQALERNQARVIKRDEISKKYGIKIGGMRKIYKKYKPIVEAEHEGMEMLRQQVMQNEIDEQYLIKLVKVLTDESPIGSPLGSMELRKEEVLMPDHLGGGVICIETNKQINTESFKRLIEEDGFEELTQKILIGSQVGESSVEVLRDISFVELNWGDCVKAIRAIYVI